MNQKNTDQTKPGGTLHAYVAEGISGAGADTRALTTRGFSL